MFAKAGVEAQLDAMFSNQVTLKSGGYIVINQTEALVAIDVNSGRSTREHNIEDTALRTNLEAADEIARQLRLRDLAGLIVVDFIDMEEGRNNRAVERRMKDALKNDRARIQVGRISHFGLLEMSRQRIRTGVLEGSTVVCPHCLGAGVVRSTASVALHVLRVLEDALIKSAAHDMTVRARAPVALYILNQKRAHLRDLERRFGVAITGRGRRHADRRRTITRSSAASPPPASGPRTPARAGDAARRLRRRAGRRRGLRDRGGAPRRSRKPKAAKAKRPTTNSKGRSRTRRRRAGAAGEGEQSRRDAGAGVGAAASAANAASARGEGVRRGRAAADRRRARGGGRDRRRLRRRAPTRAEGEAAEEEEGRAPGARRRRSRRGRRSDRDRFAPPSAEAGATETEEPTEPSLFGEELAPLSAAEPEAPAPAAPSEPERPSASEPAAPPSAVEQAAEPVAGARARNRLRPPRKKASRPRPPPKTPRAPAAPAGGSARARRWWESNRARRRADDAPLHCAPPDLRAG